MLRQCAAILAKSETHPMSGAALVVERDGVAVPATQAGCRDLRTGEERRDGRKSPRKQGLVQYPVNDRRRYVRRER